MNIDERLSDLRAKLKARTGLDGQPKANYGGNVKYLRGEIERLERKKAHGASSEQG
jgi:hypothetical protein